MRGIVGIVKIRGCVSPGDISQMTNIITHRGPDNHGYLGFNSAGRETRFTKDTAELMGAEDDGYDILLGHRGLSILDLSESGRCPMPYDLTGLTL
jgi:asparagine synthetase B (glutamine-hydrolysing)